MAPLAIGIDIGTSGARAVAMRPDFSIAARAAVPLDRFGANSRDPVVWWAAVEATLKELLSAIDRAAVRSIAVDGTSGTVLPVDAVGR
ncbi:MAG: carbohydrate kinase, partial [Mesorhizobium sp.]